MGQRVLSILGGVCGRARRRSSLRRQTEPGSFTLNGTIGCPVVQIHIFLAQGCM
jgi:hypothetical protein